MHRCLELENHCFEGESKLPLPTCVCWKGYLSRELTCFVLKKCFNSVDLNSRKSLGFEEHWRDASSHSEGGICWRSGEGMVLFLKGIIYISWDEGISALKVSIFIFNILLLPYSFSLWRWPTTVKNEYAKRWPKTAVCFPVRQSDIRLHNLVSSWKGQECAERGLVYAWLSSIIKSSYLSSICIEC